MADYHDISLIRLVTYVCMTPRNRASSLVLDHKKRGFLQNIPTSHWPNEMIHFISDEYEPGDLSSYSNEVLRLAGFTEKEIKRKKYNDVGFCNIA